jgi:type II secretion system protein G
MNKKGFTLVELLIVVAIIGIIAAIAIPNLLVALQKGKQKATMGDMKTIGGVIESYATDWSQVPQVADLAALNSASWFVPFYIKNVATTDGWGNTLYYATNSTDNQAYSIVSYGKNRTQNATPLFYDVTSIGDFTYDITYCNGSFTQGPQVKK